MTKHVKLPDEVNALNTMASEMMLQAKAAMDEGDTKSAETLYGVATRVMAIFRGEGTERVIPSDWIDGSGNLLPEWQFINRLDTEYDAYESAR